MDQDRKERRVVVLLGAEELETLKFLAGDLGLSLSSYLRQLINQQFRDNFMGK